MERVYGQRSPGNAFRILRMRSAAGEVYPLWPGHPITAHWGIAGNPAAVEGTGKQTAQAFKRAFHELDERIKLFASRRLEELDRMALQKHVDAIGSSWRYETDA